MFDSLIVSAQNEELKLREENEDDNVEYKLRLDNKTRLGKKRLLSQLNYRLDIGKMLCGKKEAHYVIGIYDNGKLGKINNTEIEESFNVFKEIIDGTNIIITYYDKKSYGDFFVLYIIVQKIENYKINELNIAFVGPSQHGKTTTISYLVYNQHDDGMGHARKLIFKHEHEKISGQTSSVKKEIIGLKKNRLVNYSVGISTSWQDIVEMSDKIINLIDLPGNMKYFRSIFFGLSTYQIDGLVIVVDPNKLYDELYNDLLFYKSYARIFNIPFVILIINDNITNSNNNLDDSFLENSLIINYSNLNNFGYDSLVNFINTIEPNKNKCNMENLDPLFYVMETYYVPDTGTIFSGIMKMGSILLNDDVWLSDSKNYYKTKVKSIHRKQIDSAKLYTNETGAIQLDLTDYPLIEINKHMIITKNKLDTCNYFEFDILNVSQNELNILNISNGQTCVMFINNSITNVKIEKDVNGMLKIKTELNIIIPEINITDKIVAFLKSENYILFGTLKML